MKVSIPVTPTLTREMSDGSKAPITLADLAKISGSIRVATPDNSAPWAALADLPPAATVTFEITDPTPGTFEFAATETDTAGRASPMSAPVPYTVPVAVTPLAPDAPTVGTITVG